MIVIKKSQTADTRTCDWTKVSKDELLKASKQHIQDVQKGMNFIANIIRKRGEEHDWTKIEYIDEFYKDFQTEFKRQVWWELHQQKERHHLHTEKYIPKDVNLIDIIEQIVDGIMAGLARSGEYRQETINCELLEKAYKNTVQLLLNEVKVENA